MSYNYVIDQSSDLQLELSTASALAEILDTPRALSVFMLIKYKEYEQLANLSTIPTEYDDLSLFRDDYLIRSVLKKSQNLPLNENKAEQALKTFLESEKVCAETNATLLSGAYLGVTGKLRHFISGVLGPLDRKALMKIERKMKFGPGATTCLKGVGSVVSDKYDADIDLTYELYPFYKSILGAAYSHTRGVNCDFAGGPWWEHLDKPNIVEGNKFTTVPKSAKTDRGICIEPTLNSYVQLGIGGYIKDQLKANLGINLHSQERNQDLSRLAIQRSLATIDLSAASDSISLELVKAVLPWEWYVLLSTPRCDKTFIDGKAFTNAKFSSMGNGYTFELETLIFASIVHTIVPMCEWHNVTVYGDDIVVPQAYTTQVILTLNQLGFKVNTEKSFLAGSFFESCGTDWFNGQNVRPFYLRRDLKADPSKSIPYALQIANNLRLYSHRILDEKYCDGRFRDLWKMLVKATPKSWRKHKIPASLGDAGIICSLKEAHPTRNRNGWEGYSVTHCQLTPRSIKKVSFGRLCVALTRAEPPKHPVLCFRTDGLAPSRGRENRRGIFGLPSQKRSNVPCWTSGLEWLRTAELPVRPQSMKWDLVPFDFRAIYREIRKYEFSQMT